MSHNDDSSNGVDTRQTLARGDWLELKSVELSGVDTPYEYVHVTRSGGVGVAVLPWRRTADSCEYLLREEITPSWGSEPHLSAVTGGVEDDDDPVVWARQEVLEETGYRCPEGAFLDLGTIRSEKCSDTQRHLFAVDLTGREPEDPSGDGTELEEMASCRWVDRISKADQDVVYALWYRLCAHLNREVDD